MSLKRRPLILTDNRSFRTHLSELGPGDTVLGLLNIKPTEEILFLDLVERGVRLFPSALAQQLSRSKCLQAMVYKKWMVPNTFVVRDRYDMIRHICIYGHEEIGAVVTKQNRLNCGLGINVWPSIEEVYNHVCFGSLTYPFVVQPLVKNVIDVRVVVIGDYSEAYWRHNPDSFRNNIYFGGNSGVYELSSAQWDLCQRIMERGKFPYAHLDLMVTEDGTTYFAEINLRGGLKGAKISGEEYHERIEAIGRSFIDSI